MGIKKISRPINKAKNIFLKWLEDHNADGVDEFEGEKEPEWDYYRSISGFVGDNLYVVDFQIWKGKLSIDYSDDENEHNDLDIEGFLQLIN